MVELQTRCVIAGGGPAGIMAGYLLARAGVPVIVLEKHADFFRDFRGDTIHPSTLELMYELGLLDEFLKQPHQEVRELRAVINDQTVPIADFTKLPTRCKFIAFMPQWDFLNFLSTHAKQFPSFQLLMQHEVVDLTFDQQRVTGVRAKTPQGELEIRADLIIGADGRHSIIQARSGLERQEFGVADRRALDADLKEAGRSSAIIRLLSTRQIARVTRPRRLLAVRLCNSQGRLR